MFDLTPHAVLRVVAGFSAIASIIGSLEWIALRLFFQDSEIYSWKVKRATLGGQWRSVELLMRYPGIVAVPTVQIAFSIALLVPNVTSTALGVCALGTAACYFLLSVRGVDGFNGGDAMAKVVMLVCAICFLQDSELVTKAGLVFLTGQLLIAYSTPGWFRLFDEKWHDGTKILGVMRTETFGRGTLWHFLSNHRWFVRMISSAIAVWEALFVLYLFLPIEMLIPLLMVGVLFHSTNAIVMGLNIFPWSFLGCYPAFVWTAQQITNYLYR